MRDQSQIDDMRAAIRGDLERSRARLEADGGELAFPRADESEPVSEEPPNEHAVVAQEAEEPEPVALQAASELDPEPDPVEPEPPEVAVEPEPPAPAERPSLLRRLFRRG